MASFLRERLTLALILLVPFHALVVTVATMLLLGPNHAPLSLLAAWKEALLFIILCLAVLEIVRERRLREMSLDAMDLCILGLFLTAIIVQYVVAPAPILRVLYAIKYDGVMLAAFIILRRVAWSASFVRIALYSLLAVAGVLSLYGIIALILPERFFLWLGYSAMHSLYEPDRPLAAFQLIHESVLRRAQSTMSGPNQFGLWLLIPLGIMLASLGRSPRFLPRLAQIALGTLVLVALFVTYSRTAWVSAGVMCIVAALSSFSRRIIVRWMPIVAGVAACCIALAIVIAPSVLLRVSSSRGHLTLPLMALRSMIEHPFGQGLGSIGPASNAVSETCVMLRENDDPSWAALHPDLCVFTGTTQVQPVSRICRCPRLAEHWYLQIGVELGMAGFLLFVSLTILILWKLKRLSGSPSPHTLHRAVFLLFLGLSLACVLLHAWEDSAVAYTAWILLAVAMSDRRERAPLMST